jgi:hypothetical protein
MIAFAGFHPGEFCGKEALAQFSCERYPWSVPQSKEQ